MQDLRSCALLSSLSISVSLCLSVCLSVCLCLPACLPACLPVCLSVCLSVFFAFPLAEGARSYDRFLRAFVFSLHRNKIVPVLTPLKVDWVQTGFIIIVIDHFYTELVSALGQTHCVLEACAMCHPNEWLSTYSAFWIFNEIVYLQLILVEAIWNCCRTDQEQ